MPIPVRISPFLCRGCPRQIYAVLASLSEGCTPDRGRLHTCYSPVRHSPAERASSFPAAVRLACVKPAASVHPEPGSNSPLLVIYIYIYLQSFVSPGLPCLGWNCSTETPDSPCSLVSAFLCLNEAYAACLVASCHCSLSLRNRLHCAGLSLLCPRRFPIAVAKLLPFSPLCKFFRNIFAIPPIFTPQLAVDV